MKTLEPMLRIGLLLLAFFGATATQSHFSSTLQILLTKGRVVVIPVNVLGLANRLRIISSAYTIAASHNASLLVVWQGNEDCAAEFQDLYTFKSSGIEAVAVDAGLTNGELEKKVRHTISTVCIQNALSVGEVYPRDFLVGGDWSAKDVTVMWTRGTHADISTSCWEYAYSKRQFYQQLALSPAVQTLVDSVDLAAPGGGGLVVGVHIRAFDERYDWAVVSPSLATSNIAANSTTSHGERDYTVLQNVRAKRFDETASLQSFVDIMGDIIRLRPNIRFFLASNSIQAKNNMIAHFGSARILTLSDEATGQREQSHGIEVAAAEFHLLGETAFVIHTRGSSFAREAASRTSIPVIDVSLESRSTADGDSHGVAPVYFFSTQTSLPLCAMPEFIRAQRPSAPATSTDHNSTVAASVAHVTADVDTDGTVVELERALGADSALRRVCYQEDDRMLCSVAYHVCHCIDAEGLLYGIRYDKLLCYVRDVDVHLRSGCVALLAESNGYSISV